jgi:hypothetical protein
VSKIGGGSIPSSGQSITGRVTGGGGVLAGRVVVGGAPVVVGQVIKSVPLVECWHCGTLADCSWETAYVLRWVHGSSEKYCALGGYVCYLDVEDSKSFILGGVSGSGLVELWGFQSSTRVQEVLPLTTRNHLRELFAKYNGARELVLVKCEVPAWAVSDRVFVGLDYKYLPVRLSEGVDDSRVGVATRFIWQVGIPLLLTDVSVLTVVEEWVVTTDESVRDVIFEDPDHISSVGRRRVIFPFSFSDVV